MPGLKFSALLLLICAGAAWGQMPTVNRNGQTLYQPDKPFGDVRAASVNGRIFADAADGADMGAKINAAIASQAGKPNTYIETAPNMVYTYTTPIVYPSGQIVDTECHGSTLRYVGTDLEGVKVLARNGGPNGSGGFHHCAFDFVTPSAHIRWESSTFFAWDEVNVHFATYPAGGNRGIDMVNVNSPVFGVQTGTTGPCGTVGSPCGGYFEENKMSFIDPSPAGGGANCFLTLRQDPTLVNNGSFFYNFLHDWHISGDGSAGQAGICLENSPVSGISTTAFGWDGNIHSNGGLSVFNLASNVGFTRAFVTLTGEFSNGTTYGVTTSGGAFQSFGANLAPGHGNQYLNGSKYDRIVWAVGPQGTDYGPNNGYNSQAKEPSGMNPEYYPFIVSDGFNNLMLFPNYESVCSDIWDNVNPAPYFRIQQRDTHDGFPVQQNNTVEPSFVINNIMDLTPNCHGVIFGRGSHDQNGQMVYPSNTYGTPDITAHAATIITYTTSGSPKEFGIKDKGGSAIVEYTLNQSLYEDDNKGHAGTAFTGDCAPAATIHVVNGRIVGCK